jgi:hypothetical protein
LNTKVLNLVDVKFAESYLRTTLPDFCLHNVGEIVRASDVQGFDESEGCDTVVESVEAGEWNGEEEVERRDVWGDGKREWEGRARGTVKKKRELDDDEDDDENAGYTRQREPKSRKTTTTTTIS